MSMLYTFYTNKFQAGVGYHLQQRTESTCENRLCGEVCETGVILRTAPQFSSAIQPSGRIGDSNHNYELLYPSYGHVAPCSISLNIGNISPSGYFTNIDDLKNKSFFGYYQLCPECDTSPYDNGGFLKGVKSGDSNQAYRLSPSAGRYIFANKPLSFSDTVSSNIEIESHLDFDYNDGFIESDGNKRDVFLYCNFYILRPYGYIAYLGTPERSESILTLRKRVGEITYFVDGYQSTREGYYNSTVCCTGWNNVYFDEITHNSGLFIVPSNSISFSSNYNDYTIWNSSCSVAVEQIFPASGLSPVYPTYPINFNYQDLSKPYINDAVAYRRFTSFIPNIVDIDISISGVESQLLSGSHRLYTNTHIYYYYETLPFPPFESHIYQKHNSSWGKFWGRFSLTMNEGNFQLSSPYIRHNSAETTASIRPSSISHYEYYPSDIRLSYYQENEYFYKVFARIFTHNSFRVDSDEQVFENDDAVPFLNNDQDRDVLAVFSGTIRVEDLNYGLFLNKEIELLIDYSGVYPYFFKSDINDIRNVEPFLYFHNAKITLQPNLTIPSYRMPMNSEFISFNDISFCKQDMAPDAILLDLSSVVFDYSLLIDPTLLTPDVYLCKRRDNTYYDTPTSTLDFYEYTHTVGTGGDNFTLHIIPVGGSYDIVYLSEGGNDVGTIGVCNLNEITEGYSPQGSYYECNEEHTIETEEAYYFASGDCVVTPVYY